MSSSIYWFRSRHLWDFLNISFFYSGLGSHPHAQRPTWKTRVSLFVWVITFNLSGLCDPVSSYATAGLARRIIWPHKPQHYTTCFTLALLTPQVAMIKHSIFRTHLISYTSALIKLLFSSGLLIVTLTQSRLFSKSLKLCIKKYQGLGPENYENT
jgi:hypothetical protein